MANALNYLTRATILQKSSDSLVTTFLLHINNTQVQNRYRNVYTEKLITDLDVSKLTDFEKSRNPIEWDYVKRCLPLKVVPIPKQFDGIAPSGWIPSQEKAMLHPYFVKRTKNHMIPVYLNTSYRGLRHITIIRKIEGNIWKLEEELKVYLQNESKRCTGIASQVNEMTGQIRFKGDHVEYIKQWMISKGF